MTAILISRFHDCLDEETIRNKVTVRPPPLRGLEALPPAVAAERLRLALHEVFIPNRFSLGFIMEAVGRAYSHSASHFSTEQQYLANVYSPPENEALPLCLTGLAGVGKSEIITALRKVLPGEVKLSSQHFQGERAMHSYWYASAREKATARQQLANILGGEVTDKLNASKLRVECRRRSYLDGISIIILDEVQHHTAGDGVARVTDLLLAMSGIGTPMIYAANYSLCHKLFNRNSEDKQRLLSNPRIMHPDEPRSTDWQEYLRECVRVSNKRFAVDIEQFSDEVYRWTFGLKRLVVFLFQEAYMQARHAGRSKIELSDIAGAYQSSAYASNRIDVEELHRLAHVATPKEGRRDLNCPFGTPMSSSVVCFMAKDRQNRVAQTIYESSRTVQEREDINAMKSREGILRSAKSNRTKAIRQPRGTAEERAQQYQQYLATGKLLLE
ncbi:AAA family ATPase [Pseudomonas coleopterorum]|uniref:AAA family ATPase n=1 Tax=Pseudomonas coleopterorum TaxID=1605838 RepID=UPI001FCF03AE|nr:AAA family ATPase [Pseudomonas coleopterorum]